MANARLGWFSPLGVAASIRSCRLPLRKLLSAGWPSGSPLPLLARTASELPSAGCPSGSPLPLFGMRRFGNCRSAGWSSGSLLPLFGTHRFGVAAGRVRSSAFRFGNCPRRVGLRAHRFRFSACSASEISLGGLALPLGELAFGLPLPLFGMRRSAPPRCRSEDRRSTTTRQLFHFKTLIPTC